MHTTAEPASRFDPGGPTVLRLLAVLIAVLLVAACGADGTEEDEVATPTAAGTEGTPTDDTGPSDDCPGGWVTPEPGTDLRTAPLDALRTRYGVTGLFVVDEMRYFEAAQDPSIIAPRYDHLRFWYVKASQQGDPGFRARWLLVASPDGAPQVVATAPHESTGFRPGSWVGFFGESDEPYEYPGLPGLYFGIDYDFVTGVVLDTGEPEGGPGLLVPESVGCLQGT